MSVGKRRGLLQMSIGSVLLRCWLRVQHFQHSCVARDKAPAYIVHEFSRQYVFNIDVGGVTGFSFKKNDRTHEHEYFEEFQEGPRGHVSPVSLDACCQNAVRNPSPDAAV